MSGAGAGAGLRALGREELRRRCAEPRYLDKLMTSLKRDVLGDGGEELLDCLLNGIPDAPAASLNNKIKVIDIVLSRLRSETTSLNHCGKLVSRVCMELPRAPTEDIVRWCEDSIDSLVHDTDVNMIWCDILPECLSVLLERGTLVHCGTQMSATDFKDQCVRTLCQCRWNERLVVRLAEMFKDMHLEREAHGQVVSKLCTQMMDMPPDSVPPLLHQLLKLCRCHHMESVLAYLSHYFNVKLYSRLRPTPQDSDSTNMDLEDFGAHTATELMACLSTCVLHIKTSSPELVRKHIKLWPRSQLLRNPFILEPALALSEGSTDNKILCLSVLKSAIQQRCLDEQRCRDSAWIRSVLPNDVDVKRILKVVIGQSIHHRQLTVSGLINLAFSLLSTSPLLGREHLALASWSFAKLILVRLAKSQPETTGHILSLLSDKLAGDFTSQRQYADCLLVLCKLTPLSVECCPQLSTILENCQASSTDFRTSAPVLDAVHPILKFSSRVRDRLVMICRKGLFTRDSSSRCLALSGFLSLLRHIKLPAGAGAGSLSNTSSEQYSVHSYLTQISIDLHSTQQGAGVTSHVRNEAVCLEVVSILRRCFTQDAQVKQLLYSSIFDCVRSKPSLHEAIMELLLEQLGKYISDEDGLQLEKCVQVNAATAVLIEPVGYLLLCTQQFLQAPDEESSEDILASQADEQGAQYYRNKLRTVMNKLADEFAKYQMTHFDMQEGEHGLSDLTPESKAKSLRTQQALHVYEALMAYRLMEWSVDSDNPATGLYALFKVYNQLLEHTKQAPKGNKKGPKSLNETTDKSQKTQKTQKATRDKQKGPVKLSHMAKGKVGPFKQLPCLWDLAVCCRILDLLYSAEVPWATREQRTQIRTKRDIHHFALRSVLSVLGGDVRRCSLLADGTRAARILYTRCIARFQEISDFDEPTALGCLDSFRECLSTAANPHNHIDIEKFLREVTDSSDGSAGDCLASILECAWSALQQLDSEADSEAEQDAMTRRINVAVVQLVSVALSKIPHEPCEQLLAVSQKLEQFVRTSKRDSLSLIPSLLAAGCRHTQDTRLMDDLIDKLTAVLHLIEEDDSNMETDQSDVFPAINETTGQTVFGYVCAHVCARSAHVEHVLGRAKELHAALKYSTQQAGEKNEKDLKELEKAVVVQLCGAAGRVCRLAALRCAVGAAGTDRALQAAVRLYSPLTALLKHLARRPTHTHIRLEKLLKLCGKRLSGFTDNLIIYVESSGSGGAQGGAGRVLRDTRLLPRLVYETEQFCKCVILLSNKTKTNYEQYLSHGTARDFRIQAPVLQEALRGQAEEEPDDEREAAEEPAVEADINDAETEVLSVAGSRSEEEDSEEEAQPSSKRPRVSSF